MLSKYNSIRINSQIKTQNCQIVNFLLFVLFIFQFWMDIFITFYHYRYNVISVIPVATRNRWCIFFIKIIQLNLCVKWDIGINWEHSKFKNKWLFSITAYSCNNVVTENFSSFVEWRNWWWEILLVIKSWM